MASKDCYADLRSSSLQTREASSTFRTNFSHLTLFPGNSNGYYSNNTPVLNMTAVHMYSSNVCRFPNNDYVLVLNHGNNIFKELPLIPLNGITGNSETGLSCPATEIPYPVKDTSPPSDNDTNNKNGIHGLPLDCYSDRCVIPHSSSESWNSTLSNANLKKMTPGLEDHVNGKSLQPAACNVSGCIEPIHTKPSLTSLFPLYDYGYRCTHCSQRFAAESDYRIHIQVHQKKCPYCLEVFGTNSRQSYRNLLKHVVLYHKDKDPCNVAHRSTIESALRGASPGNFRCYLCGDEFDSLRACLEHRVYGHLVTECWICQKTFSSGRNMQKHIKTHTGEKSHVCEYCFRTFSNSETLRRHRKKHTGDVLHCRLCSYTTVNKANLETHMNVHTGAKPFKCQYCPMAFSQKSRHVIHERSHTGDKPYACDHCDKAFIDKYSLIRHVRTHTGEKPYKCSYCSKAFAQGCQLQFHERTHTGEKPYECSQCQKKFTRRQELNKHVATHDKHKQQTGKKRKRMTQDDSDSDSDFNSDEMDDVKDRTDRLASLRSAKTSSN